VTDFRPPAGDALLRRGRALECVTLGWNVVGVAVLTVAAAGSRSLALAGFGLDSLIEIGASAIVLWELSGVGEVRRRRALRLIGAAFLALAAYLVGQAAVVVITAHHAGRSPLGLAWTAATAAVMWALAIAKKNTGGRLANVVLITEARVTRVDAILALAVVCGVGLDAAFGLWWADPLAGLVIVGYAVREARSAFAA
jgi:hypothetical protein